MTPFVHRSPGAEDSTVPPARNSGGGARKVRLVIAFSVIAVAVVLLVSRANQANMVYYVTVSELLGKEAGADERGLRVTGTVVPGTIERKDLQLRFNMTDGEKALPVSYRGVIPDTFGEEGEVVVEGKYTPEGTFEASFLMAKCPSKYEASPENPEKQHPKDIPMDGVQGT